MNRKKQFKRNRENIAPHCQKKFPKLNFDKKRGFIVMGRPGCPYYERAQNVLRELGIKMEIYDIEKNSVEYKNLEKCTQQLRSYKELKYNNSSSRFTTPIVFLGKLYIGGSDDLVEYLDDLMTKMK